MENSYKYYCNRDCKYFPCHKTESEDFNCMFCFCPLFTLGKKCGGNFVYLENGVKCCDNCLIPHRPENYDYIMSKAPKLGEVVKIIDEVNEKNV